MHKSFKTGGHMRIVFIVFIIFLNVVSNVFATEYYVDRYKGSDNNIGTSPENPWKTLTKVSRSTFIPGDIVNLKKGDIWEEELEISSSGTASLPIVYRGYGGDGPNPLIKLSNAFDMWELANDGLNKKIWIGKIPEVKNSWGAVRNGKRVFKYLEYATSTDWSAPKSIEDMENGFFYAPLNSWRFYLRHDGGNPGAVEIGSREYGMKLENKKYVIIDGIDVFGPGGNAESGSASSSHQIYISQCNFITVKNCFVNSSFTKSIFICNNSSNCVVENVKCFNQGSTAIYLYHAGNENRIINCEVYEAGNIKTDFGDMGCIGFESSGSNNKIENCYAHDNGYLGVSHIDAAISVFNTPQTTVNRCYVKNSADKAIMLSENSDYSVISYCIVDNWGVHGNTITAWPSIEGIRLGGGGGGIVGCQVYNTLFINGSITKGDYAALTIQYRENKNTKIKNNIFYDVKNVYDIKAESKDNFEGWEVANNCFFRSQGNSISWGGKKYDVNELIGDSVGFFTYDTKLGQNTFIGDPMLSSDFSSLKATSPCIDSGSNVGLKIDYYGNDVPVGNGVDIGPYEFQVGVIKPPQGIIVE
jgi:hypothetical protein